ncbi:MAG: Mur ligase family protein [Patescibacteria group bacterium]
MFKNYKEIRNWLENFIPLVYGKNEFGLARIENLLLKLENPQKKFKSILVGGTAGKGSTAFYIARLLQCVSESVKSVDQYTSESVKQETSNVSKKFIKEYESTDHTDLLTHRPSYRLTDSLKIGLHLSPHLVYIGERMQIFQTQNSKLKTQNFYEGPIPVERLVGLVNEIKPVIDDIKSKQPELLPSYFEILVAISFLYFAREKVDWAVVEVGLGGRLDATNILENEISVITNIGLDHTELLGETIEKIAKEKAGIIKSSNKQQATSNKQHNGVPVVTGATGKALKVIEKVSKSKNALLINLNTLSQKNRPETDIERYVANSYYSFRPAGSSFASQNKNLALLTVLSLGIMLDAQDVKKAFSSGFAGRFEEIDEGVVLDGAHNADKMKALIDFVRNSKLQIPNSKQIQKYKIRNSEITLVVAFKKGKNWQEMIDLLIKDLPVVKIIATQYFATTDMGPTPSQRLRGVNKGSAVEPEGIKDYIISNYKFPISNVKVVENSQEAVFEAIQSARESKSERVRDLVLVTGSLYLVGEARTLWKLPSFA